MGSGKWIAGTPAKMAKQPHFSTCLLGILLVAGIKKESKFFNLNPLLPDRWFCQTAFPYPGSPGLPHRDFLF